MGQRHDQPISQDFLEIADLLLVQGQTILNVAEKQLNRPLFHIGIIPDSFSKPKRIKSLSQEGIRLALVEKMGEVVMWCGMCDYSGTLWATCPDFEVLPQFYVFLSN